MEWYWLWLALGLCVAFPFIIWGGVQILHLCWVVYSGTYLLGLRIYGKYLGWQIARKKRQLAKLDSELEKLRR